MGSSSLSARRAAARRFASGFRRLAPPGWSHTRPAHQSSREDGLKARRETAMRLPRILIVDDHQLFAEGLTHVLKDRFEVVGTITDGRLLSDAVRRLRP